MLKLVNMCLVYRNMALLTVFVSKSGTEKCDGYDLQTHFHECLDEMMSLMLLLTSMITPLMMIPPLRGIIQQHLAGIFVYVFCKRGKSKEKVKRRASQVFP